MTDDRRKMLEALVAKRKAESQAPVRHSKPKLPAFPSKPALTKSPGGQKPKTMASSFSLKETPKKKKRVEKYQSEGSSDENDDSLSSDSDSASGDGSDSEITKKRVRHSHKPLKGRVPSKHEAKGSKSMRSGMSGKGREHPKSKFPVKEKVKGSKKGDNSSDEGFSDEDDGGDLSNDSRDEVDTSNILPSRTRRRSTQPVQYDFGNVSDDDDDSDE